MTISLLLSWLPVLEKESKVPKQGLLFCVNFTKLNFWIKNTKDHFSLTLTPVKTELVAHPTGKATQYKSCFNSNYGKTSY